MANENNQNKNQLQIQLKPEVADGKYSNLAMIGHGPNEFLIDFIFAAPGMPQAPVVSRIVMSPENAKQLMYALTDNIKKYEANFGEITQKRPVGGNNMPPFGNFPDSFSFCKMVLHNTIIVFGEPFVYPPNDQTSLSRFGQKSN